jgi:hypothetical protein
MITAAKLKAADTELKRYQKAVKALREKAEGSTFFAHFPAETGAIKRASMDLTKALANLRKSD